MNPDARGLPNEFITVIDCPGIDELEAQILIRSKELHQVSKS